MWYDVIMFLTIAAQGPRNLLPLFCFIYVKLFLCVFLKPMMLYVAMCMGLKHGYQWWPILDGKFNHPSPKVYLDENPGKIHFQLSTATGEHSLPYSAVHIPNIDAWSKVVWSYPIIPQWSHQCGAFCRVECVYRYRYMYVYTWVCLKMVSTPKPNG